MEKAKEILLKSYDEVLSENEKRELSQALETSETLRREKEILDRVNQDLSEWEAGFAPGFAERVLLRIAGETPFVFQSVFRAVALSGVAAIVLILLSVYFMDGSLNLDSLLGINGYAPDLGMLSIF
jgi:hypothetical protein